MPRVVDANVSTAPTQTRPPVRILAPSGSVFGAAMTAALDALGWRTAAVAEDPARTPAVVLVEADDGRPDPPVLSAATPLVAVCVGSTRSLDALVPLVRLGAIPLNQDAPFGQLARRVAWVLGRAGTETDRASQLAMLDRRRAEASALAGLTPSEQRVLALLADGRTARRIAVLLNRSEHTVRSQIRAVLTKLSADSQLVAVAIARRASPRPWPVEALHFTHFDDAPRSATGR